MSQDAPYFRWTFGFLAGMAAAAATALLLAPRPGRGTGDRIRRKLRFSAGSLRALRDGAARRAQHVRKAEVTLPWAGSAFFLFP